MSEFTYGVEETHLSGSAVLEVSLTQQLLGAEAIGYGTKHVAYVNMERPWTAWRLKRMRCRARRMADKANARDERWRDVEDEA